jgi:hypothetical protein
MANVTTSSKVTEDTDLAYLSFRVRPEFKREFKTYAASHDVSMTDLLVTAFQALKKAEKQKPT